MMITRNRFEIDDRHMIRNPYGIDHPVSMDAWANTLVKTRIPNLFKSVEGLEGHAKQIQNELNRLAKVENCSGEVVDCAIRISQFLRHALGKTIKDAEGSGFPFPRNITIEFRLLNDVVII